MPTKKPIDADYPEIYASTVAKLLPHNDKVP